MLLKRVYGYTTTAMCKGGIVNQSNGGITAEDGIRIGYSGPTSTASTILETLPGFVQGGITNSGLITAEVNGIRVTASTVDGDVLNDGTIAGAEHGILVEPGLENAAGNRRNTMTGSIINNTSISGAQRAGIAIAEADLIGGIQNASGATIAGGENGIEINGDSAIGKLVNAGTIRGGVNSLELNNSANAFAISNQGVLDGSVNLGLNTLNLEGGSGRVIGNVNGQSGQVNVNGVFNSEGTFAVDRFNIANGGRFNMAHDVSASGSGFNNDGTLSVASSFTANVAGNYSQTAGAVYQLGLKDIQSNYGKLAVSGDATLASGTTINVDVQGAPVLAENARVTDIIKAGGTLSSSNLRVTDNSFLFDMVADTSRDAKAVDLIVKQDASKSVLAATSAKGNSPGKNAAKVLDSLVASGNADGDLQVVINALGSLQTQDQVSDAVRQTLPLFTGAGAMATTNALHSMNRIIQSRIESNKGLSSGDEFYGNRHVWFRPFASRADQDTRDGVSGFESQTHGMAFGLDDAFNDRTRIGAVFTFADSNVYSKERAAYQKTDVKTYELVGYGSYNIDPQTDVNVQLDIGHNDNEGERRINFGGLNRSAKSDYDSFAAHASVGIGRLFSLSESTNLTPSTRLDYTHVDTDGYTEKGAGALNLKVDDSTFDETLLSADLKLSHAFADTWKFLGNVGFAYDLSNEQAQTLSSYVGGGSAFVTEGLDPSPWLKRAGVALLKSTEEGMEFTVRYDAEQRSSGFLNNTISARLRMPF